MQPSSAMCSSWPFSIATAPECLEKTVADRPSSRLYAQRSPRGDGATQSQTLDASPSPIGLGPPLRKSSGVSVHLCRMLV